MITLGVIYMPPGSSIRPRKETQYVTHILHSLDTIMRSHPDSGLFVVGDFNHMKDKHIKNFPLKQIVKLPTHVTSILDCIYTNIDQYYKTPELSPGLGLSLHKVVQCEPKLIAPNKRTFTQTYRTNSQSARSAFVDALKVVNWQPIFRMATCQEMYTYFNNTIQELLTVHLPFITTTKFETDKPWITEDYKRDISQRQHYLKVGDTVNFNRLRNIVNRKTKSLRSLHYKHKVRSLNSENSRSWFKQTKELIGLKSSNEDVFIPLADELCDGDMTKLANNTNTFFHSVSVHLIPLDKADHLLDTLSESSVISLEAVEKRLMTTKLHKSIGPDGIPNWVLRDLAGLIGPPLCAIFNMSLSEGRIPIDWKKAHVTPIPKAHPPKSITTDIRPISLTPNVSKILESFIGNIILEHIKERIDPNQYGALKGLSTTHALVDLLHNVHEFIHNGNDARICFIDYTKAFDLIDHNILLSKFELLGLDRWIINWLRDYLSDREQRVKLGNSVSTWLKLNGAVPQGSWLGPLCFIVYMNDMELQDGTLTHKYIDDITISESISSSNVSLLQTAVDKVKDWSHKNNMKLNENKTKEMYISFKHNPAPVPPLIINSNAVERVHSFKILGVWLSDDLSWKSHVNHMHSRATPRLYYLRQLRRCGLSQCDLLASYRTLIRPILEYACPVWHAGLTKGESDILEKIQKRALKIIYSDIPYEACIQKAQIEFLKTRRERLSKQFFFQICQPNHRLHYLLNKRDSIMYNLRNASKYHCPIPKTERYKGSFIVHNLLQQ